ncbi:predicted protein [Histoplasma capsulatum G186AR]|uniref:Uncharacterized protein n=1 Tax=Ajellomyces capsulatus (strain G186AR / H82 / ATCC MYA-2454 / RMSCC 2432) TaxID=447093 RepID=C0NCZ3_AJECG|nr:uncharacterized protein HCBG_00989 [Histoplasma capsulatum G186AR]EEH11534.1 predicted protein [Histoplasma capsulatum G186AR]
MPKPRKSFTDNHLGVVLSLDPGPRKSSRFQPWSNLSSRAKYITSATKASISIEVLPQHRKARCGLLGVLLSTAYPRSPTFRCSDNTALEGIFTKFARYKHLSVKQGSRLQKQQHFLRNWRAAYCVEFLEVTAHHQPVMCSINQLKLPGKKVWTKLSSKPIKLGSPSYVTWFASVRGGDNYRIEPTYLSRFSRLVNCWLLGLQGWGLDTLAGRLLLGPTAREN